MKRTLLIDADIVAFKFAAKAEKKFPFGIVVDDLDTVTPLVDEYLADMKRDLKATDIIICLSAPSSEGWRKDVLPSYKENRTDVAKPALLGPLKDHMENSYPSYRKPRLEADDIMGILSTHPTLVPGERIIVSEDKDMKTIPGLLYNPAKDRFPRRISEAEADRWHLYQAIMGDSTDGYKGCPGSGPGEANELLDKPFIWESYQHTFLRGPRKDTEETRWRKLPAPAGMTTWETIESLFRRAGLTEADALVQGQVARICRHTDYDFKTQQAILWTPPAPKRQTTASPVPTVPSAKKTSTATTRSAPKKGA